MSENLERYKVLGWHHPVVITVNWIWAAPTGEHYRQYLWFIARTLLLLTDRDTHWVIYMEVQSTVNVERSNENQKERKFLLYRPLRSVSSWSLFWWRVPPMPALRAGLLPARTRPRSVLPLWRRPHDQVWWICVLQGLWGQRCVFCSFFGLFWRYLPELIL